jgi:hypothetical protein
MKTGHIKAPGRVSVPNAVLGDRAVLAPKRQMDSRLRGDPETDEY